MDPNLVAQNQRPIQKYLASVPGAISDLPDIIDQPRRKVAVQELNESKTDEGVMSNET